MCGIVGYVGEGDLVEVIMSGLHRLEYRGYDSAGIAAINGPGLETVRAVGRLEALEQRLAKQPLAGSVGVGHTRWATHGAPTEQNAHPHTDMAGRIAVVHNGIIENFAELREELEAAGVVFQSETDTEILAHLISGEYANTDGDLTEAVRRALQHVRGAYALGVVCADQPDLLVAAREGSPLIVGLGEGEAYIASDVPAIMKYTRRVVYLDNGQLCTLERDRMQLFDLAGNAVQPEVVEIEWDDTAAEKEGYPHFMLKEIHQQPMVLRHALLSYIDQGNETVRLPDLNFTAEQLSAIDRIVIVACGTAWHAGLVAEYHIEQFARVPVEVELASEFRYRDPILNPQTLVVAISQSGETADTLEAVRIAREHGAPVLGIVNVMGSSVSREADGVIYTQAGPEIGVASTKAYTSQIMILALFAIHLGEARGALDRDAGETLIRKLYMLPDKVQWCLDNQEPIRIVAQKAAYRDASHAMFMGRGYNFPSALEGALKLKEISYIHVEGYGAGEMKHGPIALVTDALPVVCVATRGAVYEKTLSNIQEIRARSGIVLSIATVGDTVIAKHSHDVVYVPSCFDAFSPLLVAIPMQLFAYHVATQLGRDVDKPRNLAKSVTVE